MNTLGGDDARYLTQNMEALGRVELPTNGLGNRCSIHLSYRAIRDVTPLSHVS